MVQPCDLLLRITLLGSGLQLGCFTSQQCTELVPSVFNSMPTCRCTQCNVNHKMHVQVNRFLVDKCRFCSHVAFTAALKAKFID